jgi:hypothetical protein
VLSRAKVTEISAVYLFAAHSPEVSSRLEKAGLFEILCCDYSWPHGCRKRHASTIRSFRRITTSLEECMEDIG